MTTAHLRTRSNLCTGSQWQSPFLTASSASEFHPMAILNPCCCISLQTGCKAVALADMVWAAVPLLVFLTSFIPATTIPHPVQNQQEGPGSSVGHWTVFVVFTAVDLGLSVLLFVAAKTRHVRRLQWWFYVRLGTLAVLLLLLVVSLCFQVSLTLVLFDLAYSLHRLYSLWVVYLFIGHLVHLQLFAENKPKSREFAGGITVSVVGSNSVIAPPTPYPGWPNNATTGGEFYGAVDNQAYVH